MIYLHMSFIFILVPTDDRETTDSQPRQDREKKNQPSGSKIYDFPCVSQKKVVTLQRILYRKNCINNFR